MTTSVDTLVLGGGITGQMVALMKRDCLVLEAKEQPKTADLTRQFGANYLWEPVPIFETQPFAVVTHVDGRPGTADSIGRYKNKIGKPEDIGNWGLQFEPETVGHDILTYPSVEMLWNTEVRRLDLVDHFLTATCGTEERGFTYKHLVSTIPLNVLVTMAGLTDRYPVDSMFQYRPIFVVVTPRPPDAPYADSVMYVNYLSNPQIDCYRYCDRFGERHYEGLSAMGRLPTRKIYPGKIKGHPQVKPLLSYLRQQDVRCFGRYGKWEADELLHETYKDIDKWTSKLS